MEERYQKFSNLVLKGNFGKCIQFICEIEKGRVLQLRELDEDCTGTINENVTYHLEGGNTSKTILSCATLKMYEVTTILIPVDITEEAVESVVRKLLGSSISGGTDSEALQVWLLKFREDSTRLRTSVETFVDCIANGSPPWVAYRAFMSCRMITLDKILAYVR